MQQAAEPRFVAASPVATAATAVMRAVPSSLREKVLVPAWHRA